MKQKLAKELFIKFLDNTASRKEIENLIKNTIKPEYQFFLESTIDYYWNDIELARNLAKADIENICIKTLNNLENHE